MQSESQIPIPSQAASKQFATRVALFYGTLFGMTGTHLPFFTVWLKAVGIDAFWIGSDHGRSPGDPVYGAAAGDGLCGTASGLARRHHRDRLCHRPGLFHPGHPASAGAGVPDLRADLLPVDADGAADGCLCVARGEALRPQLRTVAAVGLGRLRPRRAGLRGAVGPHRRPKPDLGHRRLGRDRGAGQPRAAAAGRHPDRPPGHRQRERVAARRRLYRDYRGVGADPGQPCRLLHFRVDCLATSRVRRTDDCNAVGAGRDCRDRAVRTVAAIHPAAVDAGGDRGTERGRPLGA